MALVPNAEGDTGQVCSAIDGGWSGAPRRTDGENPGAPRRTETEELVRQIVELEGGDASTKLEKELKAAAIFYEGYDRSSHATVHAYWGACVSVRKALMDGQGSMTWASELWVVGLALSHGYREVFAALNHKGRVKVARAIHYMVGAHVAFADCMTAKEVLERANAHKAETSDARDDKKLLAFDLVDANGDAIETAVAADDHAEAMALFARKYADRIAAGDVFSVELPGEEGCRSRWRLPPLEERAPASDVATPVTPVEPESPSVAPAPPAPPPPGQAAAPGAQAEQAAVPEVQRLKAQVETLTTLLAQETAEKQRAKDEAAALRKKNQKLERHNKLLAEAIERRALSSQVDGASHAAE